MGLAHQTSPAYPATVAKITQLGHLPPGWNGHAAPKVSPAAQIQAIDFLSRVWREFYTSVPEPTIVAPTSDAGVALEWIVKAGSGELGVEVVFLDGSTEYSVRDREQQKIVEDGEKVDVSFLLYEVLKRRVAGHFVLAK